MVASNNGLLRLPSLVTDLPKAEEDEFIVLTVPDVLVVDPVAVLLESMVSGGISGIWNMQAWQNCDSGSCGE